MNPSPGCHARSSKKSRSRYGNNDQPSIEAVEASRAVGEGATLRWQRVTRAGGSTCPHSDKGFPICLVSDGADVAADPVTGSITGR
ncbi:hypothetical protein Y032_0460g1854 [Ancylostoma ceylanicum]|uniref:Uncharacterized protein n=1 Tax=Ancylostoma ceylanicum TaxID=53326 RepID=A0A016WXZ6_9BILA|nr:hypothetical protein Y032_0460g1854 [Ancylostoma ceylanicum]